MAKQAHPVKVPNQNWQGIKNFWFILTGMSLVALTEIQQPLSQNAENALMGRLPSWN